MTLIKKSLITLTILLSVFAAFTLFTYHTNMLAQGVYVDLAFIFTIELVAIFALTLIVIAIIAAYETKSLNN